MDFLKLVQTKEHKTDNKIIVGMVILVILIMSTVVFWPSSPKHHLLAYLPEDASFYYHWSTKQDMTEDWLAQDIIQERILELENILDDNFLNLQEVLWFQTDGNPVNDNYLLKFTRLPKSFMSDITNQEPDFRIYSPAKNILLINRGELIDNLEFNPDYDENFEQGISIYWQKNKAPEFLGDLVNIIEPAFIGDDVLLNWQKISRTKNRLSLLENRKSDIKDLKDFLIPKEFDLAFSFSSITSDELAENISNDLLKTFFDSLPYYNLDVRVIKDRILSNTMIWQKDDGWILASDTAWQDDILDFIDTLTVREVPGVLSDGTAYVELVASEEQNIIEHQLNGQKIIQIDQLFIWDREDQHYLTNKKELLVGLISHNQYLATFLSECLGDLDARVGDFIYFDTKDISEAQIQEYLLNHNIANLQIFSYATGTIAGINICF